MEMLPLQRTLDEDLSKVSPITEGATANHYVTRRPIGKFAIIDFISTNASPDYRSCIIHPSFLAIQAPMQDRVATRNGQWISKVDSALWKPIVACEYSMRLPISLCN